MKGGPTRNPSEPIELTAAIDGPDVSTPPAPAALKSSGTPLATPTPTSARPASATIGSASTSIVPSAIAARAEPPRSSRVGPICWLIQSPVSRPTVMPAANAANVAAASPADAPRSPRR